MRKISPLIIVSFVCTLSINAQNNKNLSAKLNEYLTIVREQSYAPTPDKELYAEENAEELLQILSPYYNDSIERVRLKAFYLTYKCAYKSTNPDLREKAVFNLVMGLKDKDSGNVGNIADNLSIFKSEDFNELTKDSIRSILHNQIFYLDKIIKLAAFVGLNDQIGYLKNNLAHGIYKSSTVIWASHLALARLGDTAEIDFCVKLVKDLPVNDDVIYELVPDLIYTRQKKAFDYLIEILNSNVKNCYSSNPENSQKILCGYRLMEYIAPVIKNFPLKTDSTGDILVDDYETALKETRAWFSEHSNSYEIITNTY